MSRFLALSVAALISASPALAQSDAVATFLDAEGATVGSANLMPLEGGGVHISGEITVGSAGEHGFHIHETGDCDPATEFESAGDHFNPAGHEHGLENPAGAHAGDMPNQQASASGVVMIDAEVPNVSLVEGEPGYLFDEDGSALVLHANADDQVTDPSGNSGDRIACAVIEAGPAM